MGRRRGHIVQTSRWQSLRRIAVATLLAIVVLIIGFGVWLAIVAHWTRRELIGLFQMVLFCTIGLLVCWGISTALERGRQRAFERAGGRLCTNCRYDLRGLGETGVCPECGKSFDIARDAEAWARAGFRGKPLTSPCRSAVLTGPDPAEAGDANPIRPGEQS
jgi:hypothetical protein